MLNLGVLTEEIEAGEESLSYACFGWVNDGAM